MSGNTLHSSTLYENRIRSGTDFLRTVLQQVGSYDRDFLVNDVSADAYGLIARELVLIRLDRGEINRYMDHVQVNVGDWAAMRAYFSIMDPNNGEVEERFETFRLSCPFEAVLNRAVSKTAELALVTEVYESRLRDIESKMRHEHFRRALAAVVPPSPSGTVADGEAQASGLLRSPPGLQQNGHAPSSTVNDH